jgi:hypothetical protein
MDNLGRTWASNYHRVPKQATEEDIGQQHEKPRPALARYPDSPASDYFSG